nr:MAG TPA: hypothetical protein [Caudoviricetes sp.]
MRFSSGVGAGRRICVFVWRHKRIHKPGHKGRHKLGHKRSALYKEYII